MKDPCSLGYISKSVVSRSREIFIPIHLRSARPHLEDYAQDWLLSIRWMLTNCGMASKRAPEWRGGECTVHREKAGGLGLLKRKGQGGI